MATISNRRQSAAITIPAAYLEDARSALMREIVCGSDMLRVNQMAVVAGNATGQEDRASAMRVLRMDIELLNRLMYDAGDLRPLCGDAQVTAESDTITDALQSMVRVLADRLGNRVEFGPIDMGMVLELAGCLRWAAENAIRIDPDLDERKGA